MQGSPDPGGHPPCHGLLAARRLRHGQALAPDEVEQTLRRGLPETPTWLHFVLTPTLLLTARRHLLRAVALIGNTAPAPTPAAQWDRITRSVLEGMGRAIQALNHRLDEAEDRLLQGVPHVTLA